MRDMVPTHRAFRRVRAVHAHWEGSLRLYETEKRVYLEKFGSEGSYNSSGATLNVKWDKYPEEKFIRYGLNTYVSDKLSIPELDKMPIYKIGDFNVEVKSFGILVPGSTYEVFLRSGSSDISTYEQVFGYAEYESRNLPTNAQFILDIGGNIGLATVFFALKYPNANVVTVEPGSDNFKALTNNTARLGNRIRRIHAAAWYENAVVNLASEGEDGMPLGDWGLKITGAQLGTCVDGITIQRIMDLSEFPRVDILKIDIEGSELELFSRRSDEWLSKVDLIIIETHDRFRKGSEAAVRDALAPEFEELPRNGENLFFRRTAISS